MRKKSEELHALGRAVSLLLAAVLPWAALGAYFAQAQRTAQASAEARVELEEPREKLIAITFDDGPSSVTTPVLLDGLAERGVRATFFLVGSMVKDNPSQVVRMAREGHQIGVHTYDHKSSTGLRGLSDAQFAAQVGVTADMITELTGRTQFALRPPYGYVDDGIRARAPGPIILWSIDPEDWRYQDAQKVAQHIISHAEDGSIILLHDIFRSSVQAAFMVIDELQTQGYRFVTVNQLFAARGIELEQGKSYHSAKSG